jgi:hypothetical protein
MSNGHDLIDLLDMKKDHGQRPNMNSKENLPQTIFDISCLIIPDGFLLVPNFFVQSYPFIYYKDQRA